MFWYGRLGSPFTSGFRWTNDKIEGNTNNNPYDPPVPHGNWSPGVFAGVNTGMGGGFIKLVIVVGLIYVFFKTVINRPKRKRG